MKTKKSLIIISLVSFIPVCLWALGSNNTGYRTTNIAQNITVNNVCRSVRNTGAQNYFAPTKTSTEWSNFITNKPSDVLIGSCCSAFTRINSNRAIDCNTVCSNAGGYCHSGSTDLNCDAPHSWSGVNSCSFSRPGQVYHAGYGFCNVTYWHATCYCNTCQ